MLPTENFAGIGIRTRDLRGDSQHSDHNIQKATSLLLLFIIIEKVDVDFGMGGQSQLIVYHKKNLPAPRWDLQF